MAVQSMRSSVLSSVPPDKTETRTVTKDARGGGELLERVTDENYEPDYQTAPWVELKWRGRTPSVYSASVSHRIGLAEKNFSSEQIENKHESDTR